MQMKHVVILTNIKRDSALQRLEIFSSTKYNIMTNFKYLHASVDPTAKVESEEAIEQEVPQMWGPIRLK